MTATTTRRLTPDAGEYPSRGTFPMPANTYIRAGTIVQLDASDRAIEGANANGFYAVGKAAQSYDNRTGSIAGGANDSLDCEVEYGVFGFAGEANHLPTVGDICFVADNQTVSTDSASTTRGVAGRCVEVRDGSYWIYMGPHVGPQIIEAAAVAADVVTLTAEVDALIADAESAAAELVVPLGSLRTSTGAALPAFGDGTADGFSLVGSECLGIRWNDTGGSRATVAGECQIPSDWDDTAAVVLHVQGFRVGSADAAMVGTVTMFAQSVGDAYTADADAGGSTTAFNGATTVITDETLAVLAGVLPAGSKVSFTFVPDAALDGDDFVLTGIRFVGTRKMRTS
jgi:hypothetical protein